LTANGDVEMDAVIMDGKTLKSGGVACVHNIQNPITLAREVMEKVHHFYAKNILTNALFFKNDYHTKQRL
jgi:isoaspartyl peptidase/L-asparaginase-like protein (Ntn-hydrolase superfamily)